MFCLLNRRGSGLVGLYETLQGNIIVDCNVDEKTHFNRQFH